MTTRRARLCLTLLLALAITPLQAFAGKNAVELPPLGEAPVQLAFSDEQLSKWTDLPMGTYRVPNSDVIISGHQKGGAAPFLLFGLIGMAVQNSVNAHNGKEAQASAEQALTFTIDEESNAKLQAALAANPAYASRYTTGATDPRLEIQGSVVLSYARDQDVLPYVILRVKLMGGDGKKKLWTTRYIASKGERRPLTGEGGWTADGGAPLRAKVSELLDLAIGTMLKDIANPYPRDEASLVTVHGWLPHVNKPIEVIGYKLAEENGQMLFLPKLGTTIVFAGVNVIDTDSVWSRPTQKGDKPLKLLKMDDPTLVALLAPAPAAAASATATAEPAAPATTEATEVVGTDTEATAGDVIDAGEAVEDAPSDDAAAEDDAVETTQEG
jgi:hypothetical protein